MEKTDVPDKYYVSNDIYNTYDNYEQPKKK